MIPPVACGLYSASMTFTGELWTAMTPIYETILRHPFVTGLTDGSLPRDSFRFYAVQDALYPVSYTHLRAHET